MRRRTDQPTTVWNAQVDSAVVDELKRRIPAVGIRVWVVTQGLQVFLDEVRNSPRAQKIVHDDIQFMLREEERKKDIKLVPMNVRIPTQAYTEFNTFFPEWGGATWFMRRVLQNVVGELTEHDFDLTLVIAKSVAHLYRNNRPAVNL